MSSCDCTPPRTSPFHDSLRRAAESTEPVLVVLRDGSRVEGVPVLIEGSWLCLRTAEPFVDEGREIASWIRLSEVSVVKVRLGLVEDKSPEHAD